MTKTRREELAEQLRYSSALIKAMAESFKKSSDYSIMTEKEYVEKIHERANEILGDEKKD